MFSFLVSTHNQYLVPKDGTPLSGLIQDHVVSGVIMTTMDRAFDRLNYCCVLLMSKHYAHRAFYYFRTMYQQLLYAALPDCKSAMKVLPPAYIKPKYLWSGKQVCILCLHVSFIVSDYGLCCRFFLQLF